MKATFKEENNDFVMYLDGRLDTAASGTVDKDFRQLDNCEGHNIIIDCAQLEYISSSGLRIFLSVLKNAKARGSKVFIRGISNDILNVFKMTGFINLFEFK